MRYFLFVTVLLPNCHRSVYAHSLWLNSIISDSYSNASARSTDFIPSELQGYSEISEPDQKNEILDEGKDENDYLRMGEKEDGHHSNHSAEKKRVAVILETEEVTTIISPDEPEALEDEELIEEAEEEEIKEDDLEEGNKAFAPLLSSDTSAVSTPPPLVESEKNSFLLDTDYHQKTSIEEPNKSLIKPLPTFPQPMVLSTRLSFREHIMTSTINPNIRVALNYVARISTAVAFCYLVSFAYLVILLPFLASRK